MRNPHVTRRWLIGVLCAAPLIIGAECGLDEPDVRQPGADPSPGATRAAPQPTFTKKVEDKDGNGVPDPYEVDKDQLEGHYVVAISAWVEPEFGSYRVTLNVTDRETGQAIKVIEDMQGKPEIVMQAGTQFAVVLGAPDRHRVEINLHVQADRPGSTKGYLAVRPEGRHAGRKTQSMNGLAAASLLTTCG